MVKNLYGNTNHLFTRTGRRSFYSVDKSVIESIDAVDNGYLIGKDEVHMPTLNQFVKGFNPNWNTDLDAEVQFNKAIEFCTPILLNAINGAIATIEAEKIVKRCL